MGKVVKGKVKKIGKYPQNWIWRYCSSDGRMKPFRSNASKVTVLDVQGLAELPDGEYDIEFEWGINKAEKIRPLGKEWDKKEDKREVANRNKKTPQKPAVKGDFHNPYNFIPTPDRSVSDKSLGDSVPVGHYKYFDDRWSGRIKINLEAVTPVIIPDTDKVETEEGHKTYKLSKDTEKLPYIPPTSFKGALRSSYEAITNSRMGVFEKHDERLGRRMIPDTSYKMIPARVSQDGKEIVLFNGFGKDLAAAAWLPKYKGKKLFYAGENGEPRHGDDVVVWLEEISCTKRDNKFSYWKVTDIARKREFLPTRPSSPFVGKDHTRTRNTRLARGIVYVTNKNIYNKHDERVFIYKAEDGKKEAFNKIVDLSDGLKTGWTDLIKNYKSTDEKKSAGEKKGESIQIKTAGYEDLDRNKANKGLCYAYADEDGNILGLYPVFLSRELHEVAPIGLLSESLRPACDVGELSPADRVFGWVRQNANCERKKGEIGAYKGQLRVGPIKCNTKKEAAVKRCKIDMEILSSPRPEQAHFYVAENSDGKAQNVESKKEAGYKNGKGLRGRKVYPHHKPPLKKDEYSTKDISNQNYTIMEQIAEKTKFSTWIDVINLSDVELGALLWLLNLGDGHHLKIGAAKPYGFGSMKIKVTGLELSKGQGKKEEYKALFSVLKKDSENYMTDGDVGNIEDSDVVKAYEAAVLESYGGNCFKDVSFIAAFLRGAKGYDDNLPIHYPRMTKRKDVGEDSKIFKWFGENTKPKSNHGKGRNLSLPDLARDRGLPYNLFEPEQQGGRR